MNIFVLTEAMTIVFNGG